MWKTYTDPTSHFSIKFPETTAPETIADNEPGLLSRVRFKFEQPFQKGADAGTLKFNLQVSVWQNTNHLSAEAWAKHAGNSQLQLDAHPIRIAGRAGVAARITNQAWTVLAMYVGEGDRMFELRHTDIAANQLLPDETRLRWDATFNRIAESFSILSNSSQAK